MQCLKKSMPGSEYCFVHQPREVWPTLVVGAFLGFILGYLTNYIFYKKSLKDNLVDRYISQQRYVPPSIDGFPIIIANGTNNQVVRQPASFPIFSGGPFKFRVDEKGIIEIYGEIRYPDNTLVVTIHKDQVNITPGTGIDINGDSKALEIVDSNGSPVFQLSVIPYEQWKEQDTKKSLNLSNEINERILSRLGNAEPEHKIEVEGEFLEREQWMQAMKDNMCLGAKEVIIFYYIHHTGNLWWCVTPSGSQITGNRESMQKFQREIPRLFKYPGYKYPGGRVESQN